MDAQISQLRARLASSELPASLNSDDVYRRFLLTSDGDVAAASARMQNLSRHMNEIEMADPAALTPQVVRGLSMGCFHVPGCSSDAANDCDDQGRPIIGVQIEHVDWTKCSTLDMMHACIYVIWRAAVTSDQAEATPTYAAQTLGLTEVVYMRGLSTNKINKRYNEFAASVVTTSMPARIGRGFVVDAPHLFTDLLWPVGRVFVKPSVREKIAFVNEPKFPSRSALLEHLPENLVPVAHGGSLGSFAAGGRLAEIIATDPKANAPQDATDALPLKSEASANVKDEFQEDNKFRTEVVVALPPAAEPAMH